MPTNVTGRFGDRAQSDPRRFLREWLSVLHLPNVLGLTQRMQFACVAMQFAGAAISRRYLKPSDGASESRWRRLLQPSSQADQGLLVAWGGHNKGGRKELTTNRHKIRLWEAEDVLNRLFDVYDDLSADTRSRLPMTRAWILNEETG
ncbi:hypothetical protein Q9R29_08550 [Rothia sp. ARF10]|nr:hypothetical protein [Rothia sp. ARF10]